MRLGRCFWVGLVRRVFIPLNGVGSRMFLFLFFLFRVISNSR